MDPHQLIRHLHAPVRVLFYANVAVALLLLVFLFISMFLVISGHRDDLSHSITDLIVSWLFYVAVVLLIAGELIVHRKVAQI